MKAVHKAINIMLTETSLLLTLTNLHNRKLNSCQAINKTVYMPGGTPLNPARVEWLALLISSLHFALEFQRQIMLLNFS